MTNEELKLLKLDKSVINLDKTRPLAVSVVNPFEPNKCYVLIGRCKYYNFAEAQAILNNLEKHYDGND